MLKAISIKLIELYQRFYRNIINLPTCRFFPSCSEYTKQAICKYGVIRGCLIGAGRISRCHPFSGKSGYDPLE